MELPSAPPESQVLIGFDQNEVSEQSLSILPQTPNTANIERQARLELDVEKIPVSIFKNEALWAKIWCSFIFLYWSIAVWFPIIYEQKFTASAGLIIWSIGFIGILSTSYLLHDGQNPSGSTQTEPNKVNGNGRYSSMILVFAVLADFTLRIYDTKNKILNDPKQYDLILISGHTISIFWCSFFYYGRFKRINPEIANVVFITEWSDILMTIIAFVMLVWFYDNGCNGHWLCQFYFLVIPIKFILWIVPMMMMKQWGTKANGTNVSIQVFATNLITNLPIIILIGYEQLYSQFSVVYIDFLLKTCIIIRGTAYYMIFNVWLNRGLRGKFKKRKNKKSVDRILNETESETVALNQDL